MARPQSFGKRENEKKKAAKRIEKQKRKEDRKAGASSSGALDDMIAYVDENGMILDAPPETKKEEVKLEEIAISTPKKEDVEPEVYEGRVEHFNEAKGYGFIKDLASGEKYFFHISSAPAGITEGNIVTFDPVRGTRGMNTEKIVLVKK